ncbi:MAG: DUF1284 domain-containing protein [Ruminococcaceae bacterium]|nr:DUF1284 domain-containing protein [Oscillospiraceae bacterium]
MNDCIYKIRPHHGMCISFFRGEGYSNEFTSHMARIVSELSADPLVEIISATDELCEKCPSNMGDGICQTEEKVARYDSEVLRYCGFSAGEVMPYSAFSSIVREKIILCGKREEICGD